MTIDDALRRGYAPTGTLRAALNFGNRVLVGRGEDGTPIGISVDLARAISASLDLPLRLVEHDRAVDVSDSAEADAWDLCFLAVDPKRADTIAFTEPYVRIAGCYLVAANVSVECSRDVIAGNLAIGVVEGSAYTLHLSRQPGAERLTVLPDIKAALAALDAGEVAGIAGIEQAMAQEASLRPGARVLQPPFMEIRQAMGMPTGRERAMTHLRGWLANRAQDGTVAAILEKHGIPRASAVVPA